MIVLTYCKRHLESFHVILTDCELKDEGTDGFVRKEKNKKQFNHVVTDGGDALSAARLN